MRLCEPAKQRRAAGSLVPEISTLKSALRPKTQGLPAGECRHNRYLFRGAYSRSRLSRRTVSRVPMVCLDTAAIRYVHSTTPIIEWLMPDRLEERAFAFHPLKGNVPGKREHDQ